MKPEGLTEHHQTLSSRRWGLGTRQYSYVSWNAVVLQIVGIVLGQVNMDTPK